MTLSEIIKRIDDVIIEGLFQPIANHLPENSTPMGLGLSFELGSVILQAACAVAPSLLFGLPLGSIPSAIFGFLVSLVFFLVCQKLSSLVRPGYMNPLRPQLRALRLIGILFLLYDLWRAHPGGQGYVLWWRLDELSQLTFIIGLYFMACETRPPKKHRESQKTSFMKTGSVFE
ncbi:hypothetical protein GT348_01055 [Aristophania vespae]|uniref:Uncharacterized protein n=1 Tax=Aristophania vespae TaxID=2697033 RepID=A0A6P1N955_9PROT|nr:hypothetical protein [Aristophania vespae]QHI95075.1 hypothetical protein GT348_01055 [Aristophania vespae]UMM64264.1 hypothetical protein DM15PD_12740 [Aristophania vespae]